MGNEEGALPPSPVSPLRPKILVIRGGAIGDFILTLPALAALRRQFPATQLELLGYARTAGLALAGGLVEAVRSIEARPLAGFFARHGTLADELQEYFDGFAIIISYLYDPDGVFQTNVARCSKAQFIIGPHRPDENLNLHASDVFLKPLERLAIFDPDPVPRLSLARGASPFVMGFPSGTATPAEPKGSAAPLLDNSRAATLALHPGSGSETKNWPEANWSALLDRLAEQTAWHFLIVGGEAEGSRLERLASRLPEARMSLARDLPLVDLAERLQPCQAFVGHDSGITHLAAALGLPGLVLWGNSSEAIWRPRSARMEIVRDRSGLTQLPVELVARKLRGLMAHGP